MFKTPIFYFYYIWAVFLATSGLVVIGQCAADARHAGMAAAAASVLVGIVTAFSGISRPVMGVVYDKTNATFAMLLESVIVFVGYILIMFAYTTETPWAFAAGAVMCGFAYGSVMVIGSVFVRERYGAANYPKNFSVVAFAGAFASLIQIAIGLIAGADNRMVTYIIIFVLVCITFAMVYAFNKIRRRELAQK